ncbi:MAG TPA: triose-phosphate isomerase [Lentisphaeria bacterium]|nr:MAG: triose-phosphate isomerase [Lentisphaerae bacterium GWF2_38_69]HBM17522.1 triose-phosphate isomerase [Lentisphaeria bacterium]
MKKRMLFIAGNWKMNKTSSEAEKFLVDLKSKLAPFCGKLNLAVCPAFTALETSTRILHGSNIGVGSQDISAKDSGAFTGEVSAKMLLDIGVRYAIVGHSERRQYHAESDAYVNSKAKKALSSGLIPIVCIGETLQEREAGKTSNVITTQVKGSLAGLTDDEMLKTVIAYEPVWAIGTGKTATPAQAQEVHALIRKLLTEAYGEAVAEKVIIQYGGSVKADNSQELMSQKDIDGALVGGASLEVEGFYNLVANAIK